jgi:hypothetical protein
VIAAQVPFDCPQCGRPYHIKVDLLKLRRLNRIAVCGSCKHQFSVSVRLDNAESGAPPDSSRGSGAPPDSSRGSGAPPDSSRGSGAPPDSSRGSGAPPDSSRGAGGFRSTPPSGSWPPPASTERKRGARALVDSVPPQPSDHDLDATPPSGWPQSGTATPVEGKPSGWPHSRSRAPSRGAESKLPSSRPRLGWSRRRGSQPAIPTPIEGEPVMTPRPSWPDLDLELPPRSSPRPLPSRGKRKEIVVEVGDKGTARRSRRAYRPESLVTEADEDGSSKTGA